MACVYSLTGDSASLLTTCSHIVSIRMHVFFASVFDRHVIRFVREMAKSRAYKLKRLNDFRRSMPHVTASALSKVLHGIIDQGMPSPTNRNDMRETTLGLMDEETPH